jgi:hypothetical protein
MLGGAAEKAFLLLIDAYTNAISDEPRRERFKRNTAGPIKRKLDEFAAAVPTFRSRLPSSLEDNLDSQLTGIFDLIRTTRNDVGHPTGRLIDRQLAFAHLRLFISYCKRVYDLIDWFGHNQV